MWSVNSAMDPSPHSPGIAARGIVVSFALRGIDGAEGDFMVFALRFAEGEDDLWVWDAGTAEYLSDFLGDQLAGPISGWPSAQDIGHDNPFFSFWNNRPEVTPEMVETVRANRYLAVEPMVVLEDDMLEIGVEAMSGDRSSWLFDASLVRDLHSGLLKELGRITILRYGSGMAETPFTKNPL